MLILQANGLNAVARVVVVADHQGIVCNHQVFWIVQHWLHAEEPDPFYDPLSDYVIPQQSWSLRSTLPNMAFARCCCNFFLKKNLSSKL
jgi:hypothetical protein